MGALLKLIPIGDGKYELAEDWNGIPAGFCHRRRKHPAVLLAHYWPSLRERLHRSLS